MDATEARGCEVQWCDATGHRLVASLLDFETAMTIADYTAIGFLIVLAILAVVMLYLRGKL